jgi:DNA processing protein
MLGVARPYALWLRGEADLRYCCLQSVSIVGARAASAYGQHVGTELAAALAARGWTVVSGAAYGVDACAHQGALAADGVTIAVLACGVDHAYPPGHYDLLASIAAQGVLVSEWPPGRTPNRLRFLTRNRVIGALTRGTVVVEAGLRSGALNTARHARDLHRPVMAVPGPVTSEVSAGCHKMIREWGAVCVTSAHDVLELLAPLGETSAYGPAPDGASGYPTGSGNPAGTIGQLPLIGSPGADRPLPPARSLVTARPAVRAAWSRPGTEPLLPPGELGATSRAVLDAIPARGAGPAVIAVRAGRSVDAVVSSLGLLAAGGYVERCSHGWRLRRSP